MRDAIAELEARKAAGTLAADSDHFSGDFPPLSEAQVSTAEKTLGFRLNPLLRRIYLEVSNGGFGPSYGLLGLTGGMLNEDGQDSTTLYAAYRTPDPDDEHWKWPEGLIPAFHLGCAMYLCVDCNSPDGAITWFEPNPHDDGEPWDTSFIPFSQSLATTLLEWIDGIDPFDNLFNEHSEQGEEPDAG